VCRVIFEQFCKQKGASIFHSFWDMRNYNPTMLIWSGEYFHMTVKKRTENSWHIMCGHVYDLFAKVNIRMATTLLLYMLQKYYFKKHCTHFHALLPYCIWRPYSNWRWGVTEWHMFILTSRKMFKNRIKVENLCLISLLNFFTLSLEGKSGTRYTDTCKHP
jgi:hypothetical protein